MRESDRAGAPAGRPEGRPLRLYLAEDAESVRAQLAAWVGDAGRGLTLEAFPSARALLRRSEYDRPDLALVDLTLPGVDGLTALRALRGERVQVALLSPASSDGARSALEGLLEGAADCFWKRGSGRSEKLSSSRLSFLRRVRAIVDAPMDKPGEPIVRSIAAGSSGLRAPGGSPTWFGLTAAPMRALRALLLWHARASATPPAGMLIGAPMPRRVTHVLADCATRLWHRPVLELQDGETFRPGPWRIVPEGALAQPAAGPNGPIWRLLPSRGPEAASWVPRQIELLRHAPFDDVRLFLFDDPPVSSERLARHPVRAAAEALGEVEAA
jgi:chemotaxis response regulator CheB